MTPAHKSGLLLVAAAIACAVMPPAHSQTVDAPARAEQPSAADSQGESSTVYKPPPRGAPGGRAGGASRSASAPRGPLPEIELLAPLDHTGVTARPDPTLYFFVSRAVEWPTQFTVSAPMQVAPILEVTIPSPRAPGFHAVSVGNYHARLQPGIVYTWSVSIVLDPRAWSRNIVASATLQLDAAAAHGLPTAARLAQAGLWYDAVAAAIDEWNRGDGSAAAALLRHAGIKTNSAGQRTAVSQ